MMLAMPTAKYARKSRNMMGGINIARNIAGMKSTKQAMSRVMW